MNFIYYVNLLILILQFLLFFYFFVQVNNTFHSKLRNIKLIVKAFLQLFK